MRAEEARKYLERLGIYVSTTTFRRWVKTGLIPFRRPGGKGGHRHFQADDLEELARKQKNDR